LNNCVLSGNSAGDGGGVYGGVNGGTLNNGVLSGNSADAGGGARYATLNNCTLSGNSAGDGGGVDSDEVMASVAGSLRGCFGKLAVLGDELLPGKVSHVPGIDIEGHAARVAHCQTYIGLRPFGPPAPDGHLVRAGVLCTVGREGMLGRGPAVLVPAGAHPAFDRVQGQDAKAALRVFEGGVDQHLRVDLDHGVRLVSH
jgi:hypothetical protein